MLKYVSAHGIRDVSVVRKTPCYKLKKKKLMKPHRRSGADVLYWLREAIIN